MKFQHMLSRAGRRNVRRWLITSADALGLPMPKVTRFDLHRIQAAVAKRERRQGIRMQLRENELRKRLGVA